MLNPTELKVIYKALQGIELDQDEKAIVRHLIVKFEIEYKITL
jgi:hypothetical protein